MLDSSLEAKSVGTYNQNDEIYILERSAKNQKILNWDIDVKGCSIELETHDYQGNKVHLCKT